MAGPPRPEEAQDAAELVAALRRLRLWSGLTYRQLERKAAAVGAVLPSSTVATALGRPTLPREQLVETLVRACGRGDAEVDRWLAARKRIAMLDEGTPQADAQTVALEPTESGAALSSTPSEPGLPRARRPRKPVLLTLVGGLFLAGLGASGYALSTDNDRPATARTPAAEVAAPGLGPPIGDAGSFVQIRAARAPELCLSEGRDERDRYPNAVAALRPCPAAPPRTFLEPISAELVFIKWHSPTEGIGCLTLLTDGVAADMLEPWNDCSEARLQQLFRFERLDRDPADHYRLRSAYTGRCIGLLDGTAMAGATVVQEDCTEGPEQQFLIDLLPPA
ncbi:XRE family transcriptional regulator [Micromonospora sp. DR5-3]|uniref:XRE family transcriptional regulator n=1 Tax=unclassified Micromonospora TaxID=2617518 RepID=UPI0011DA0278|nr:MULTISPECIES: XRE family transcriptional regulator [unclassified Micromonospora]MCW3815444.1 XRE family transcriptional regulator [Micromonospora sp. DR5-3]TYC24257.1 XRE family transcriptional regulator [Micromonospora sp. MP36]